MLGDFQTQTQLVGRRRGGSDANVVVVAPAPMAADAGKVNYKKVVVVSLIVIAAETN